MNMNKEEADALCAIIALGFVGQNERDSRTNRSIYLYDNQNDLADHEILHKILMDHFGINMLSNLQNAKDTSSHRKMHPFIYALPFGNVDEPRMRTYDEVKGNEPGLLDLVQITETAINSLLSPQNRLRGAYIGGFINLNKGQLSLIGPSSLYLRDRRYLAKDSPSPASLVQTYTGYANVTKEVKRFLKECTPTFRAWDKAYNNIVVAPDLTDALILEGEVEDNQAILDQNKIFSSCHGLITSMYYHSDVSRTHLDEGVCIELSLSDDTCKSASCIPCAIFAASQGAPASAVHFGRGDFWNLPKEEIRNSLNPKFEENWRSFVISCFVGAAHEILQRGGFPVNTIQMANLANVPCELEKIPEMFLDALTFEGPFIKKMIDNLQR